MAERTNIPPHQEAKRPSEQELLELLRQNMPGERPPSQGLSREDMDADAAEDPFYQDALEGLKAFDSADTIKKNADLINHELQKKLRRSSRKKSVQLSHVFWYIIAVIVVIMVILLAYAVISLKV